MSSDPAEMAEDAEVPSAACWLASFVKRGQVCLQQESMRADLSGAKIVARWYLLLV